MDKHKNFALSNITVAPSPANSGTSLSITVGDGSKFPAAPFNAVVWPVGSVPTTANAEVVRVTNVGSDIFTITRTQENSSARSIQIGDQIANANTVKVFTDIENSIPLNVKYYGAVGDSSTDDSSAIQSAINAVIANGGGELFLPPAVYKIATTLTIDPSSLSHPIKIRGYGAKLAYTGSSDAILIKTNIAASDIQHAEKSVHIEGLHITGTASATSAIHNKATFTTLNNLVIEDFTSTTTQNASIVMDAMFHFWVEECHLQNIDIKNTGNGICFISQDDSAGTAASIANNQYTNIHIWLTQTGGSGIYGIGLGASTLVQIARSVFSNIIIHFYNTSNLIGFDLRKCYVEGTVFLAPGIDVFGTASSSTAWNYTFSNGLTILGPTFFPLSGVTTKFTGGGQYIITGGNAPSTLAIDSSGNITTPGITFTSPAWASWTPTLTNVTVGNGTINYAVFWQIGKTVHFRMKFTLGSTSAITGAITISLPVANTASGYSDTAEQLLSSVTLQNTGVNTYQGGLFWASTTTASLRAWNASGTYLLQNTTSSTIPFTWTTGDYFQVHGTYEAS